MRPAVPTPNSFPQEYSPPSWRFARDPFGNGFDVVDDDGRGFAVNGNSVLVNVFSTKKQAEAWITHVLMFWARSNPKGVQ